MLDSLLFYFKIIGSLGYVALLVLGPIAWKAAGKSSLLPFLFRVLAILVILAHVKIQYFQLFDIDQYNKINCVDLDSSICTIAKVTKISNSDEFNDSYATVEFFDENNQLVSSNLRESSSYYYLPTIGDKILISYSYNYEKTSISYMTAQLERKLAFINYVLIILSSFILLFSIFIEYKIRFKTKGEFHEF